MAGRELLAAEKVLLDKFADIRDEKLDPRKTFVETCVYLGIEKDSISEWEFMSDAEVDELPGGQRLIAKYVRGGLILSDLANNGNQPVYHDRRHTSEAIAAAGILAKEEFGSDPQKTRLQGVRLLVAMVGHDIFHDGRTNEARKKWMEVISANETDDVLEAVGLSDGEKRLIGEIILGTEFSEMAPENRLVYEEKSGAGDLDAKSILKALANDADILASVLPITGPTRGKLLAQELCEAKVIGGETPATWKGRLDFLETAPLVSIGARRLGFRQLQEEEIAVLQKSVFGDEKNPPLDSLPFPEARVLVLKSLGYSPEMRVSERPGMKGPEASMDMATRQLKLF